MLLGGGEGESGGFLAHIIFFNFICFPEFFLTLISKFFLAFTPCKIFLKSICLALNFSPPFSPPPPSITLQLVHPFS